MTTNPEFRHLAGFTGSGYDKGRSRVHQALWFATSHLIVQKWWCPADLRVMILRSFGAEVGRNVLVRQRVRVHWPWKLTVGNDVWIGEGVWLLNLEPIRIGNDVCISQEALICTGSHDARSATMEFDNAPIDIGDNAWIATRAVILRGTQIARGTTVAAGAVVSHSTSQSEFVPRRPR